MISIFLIFIISVIILGCLLIKLFSKNLAPKYDRIVSFLTPAFCFTLFFVVLFFNGQKRKADNKELSILLESLLDTKLSNRVYASNNEKYVQINYLKTLLTKVDSIENDLTFVSFICGKSNEIENKVDTTKKVIQNNIKWLNRLNDFYSDSIGYDVKRQNFKTMRLIEPPTDSLPVLNMAFKYIIPIDSIVCTYVEILHNDYIVYAKAFKNNGKINCFNLPNSLKNNVRLELGYIKREGGKLVFNYIDYGRE